jgi:hypothetical protein
VSQFVRPERSYDRLAFLNRGGEQRLRLLEHPSGMELERVFRCVLCRTDIAVGPCFEHIDPAGFVGAVCGCLDTEPLDSPEGLIEAAGRPGTAAEAAENV